MTLTGLHNGLPNGNSPSIHNCPFLWQVSHHCISGLLPLSSRSVSFVIGAFATSHGFAFQQAREHTHQVERARGTAVPLRTLLSEIADAFGSSSGWHCTHFIHGSGRTASYRRWRQRLPLSFRLMA